MNVCCLKNFEISFSQTPYNHCIGFACWCFLCCLQSGYWMCTSLAKQMSLFDRFSPVHCCLLAWFFNTLITDSHSSCGHKSCVTYSIGLLIWIDAGFAPSSEVTVHFEGIPWAALVWINPVFAWGEPSTVKHLVSKENAKAQFLSAQKLFTANAHG